MNTGLLNHDLSSNKLRDELNARLQSLTQKGILLADIAKLLDAEEFIEHIEPGRGQSTVVRFDVDRFIKKRTGEDRKINLPNGYTKVNEIILPPSEKEMKFGSGAGFKEMGTIPRSTLIVDILTEMDLKYSVIEGAADPRMIRKLSYLVFDIPSIHKLVLANDEEGNATFIIHKAEQEEWKNYIQKTKDELYAMPYNLVSVVIYPDKNKEGHQDKWKNAIKNALMHIPTQPEVRTEKINSPESTTAPEGWGLASQIADSLKANVKTIRRYADKYRSEHPEWFKMCGNKFNPRGLSEFYSPELMELAKGDYNKIKFAPEGWVTASYLRTLLNAANKTIQEYLRDYRATHPEWFEIYRMSGGKRIAEHISPELLEIIRKRHLRLESAPEGWLTAASLSKIAGVSFVESIQKQAETFRQANPEWFEFYKNIQGKEIEHYSPELVETIISERKETTSALEGWASLYSLSGTIGIDPATLKKYSENYRPSHPEYFKKRGARELLSPELSEILFREYGGVEVSPDGWLTANALSKVTGIGSRTLKQFAEKYRIEHPEWFRIYKNISGKNMEHFHPDLLAAISKDFEKIKNAPDGWLVAYALANKLDITPGAVQYHAEKYRSKNPEWFKIYRIRRGHFREHYSPELVNIIENEPLSKRAYKKRHSL